ncbi:glutathione S-transferase [Meredithblackwellia eburnea MCA 4105]
MSVAPPRSESGIDLYTVPTPNGLKVSLALEELKLSGSPIKWTEHKISFATNEQKEPWFLAINPNGRIPAIIDNDRKGLNVWETGSILRYLTKYYDPNFALHFPESEEDYETEMYNWVYFQHGGLGPMQGQAGHFLNAAPEKVKYGARRYIDETKRLLQVYEDRLKDGREYLVGPGKGKFSLADVVAVTWARGSGFSLGVPHLSEIGMPNVQAWIERIEARPAGKITFASDFVTLGKQKDGWEQTARDKVSWVWAEDGKPKDEL